MKFNLLKPFKNIAAGKLLAVVFAAVSSMAMFSCTKDDVTPTIWPEPVICPPHDSTSHCTPDTYVTVRFTGCGVGVYGAYWLQLDNGDYLQPWSSDVIFTPQDGQRLKINYQEVTRDSRFDSVIVCQALVPTPTAAIHVACLRQVQSPPSNQCSVLVTADDMLCGFGVWGEMYFKLADGTHLQPWESLVNMPAPQHGQQYKIGYELMQPDNRYDSVYVCLAIPDGVISISPARITCVELVTGLH